MKMTESILTQAKHPAGSDCLDDYRPFTSEPDLSPRIAVAPSGVTVQGLSTLPEGYSSPDYLEGSFRHDGLNLPNFKSFVRISSSASRSTIGHKELISSRVLISIHLSHACACSDDPLTTFEMSTAFL